MNILGYDIKKATNGAISIENQQRRKKSASQAHDLQQKFQTREDLATLRIAIEVSDNIVNFNRFELHQIYRRIIKDTEYAAQWNTRVLKTLDKEFNILNIEGKVDKVAMELFQAPWFFEWIKLALEERLWGFSLIEFGPWSDETNAFEPYTDTIGRYHTAVEAVDRDYVKPEFGVIVPHYGDEPAVGTSYLRGRFADRLMFLGGPRKDDDILYNSAPYMLMKENAMKNWSEWAEVYATDMRIGKTEAQGTDRTDFIKAMRNMGSNGYAVIDTEDEIEYVGVNRQDAYKVYQAFLQYCDGGIAKLIFGQDVVTNNTGRVVGKVGEDVANMYGDSDAKYIQWIINTRLIPMMDSAGAEVSGIKFKYDTTEKLKLADRAKVDKAISDMGWRINEEYLTRTYGVKLDEYIGIPFSGREGDLDEPEE